MYFVSGNVVMYEHIGGRLGLVLFGIEIVTLVIDTTNADHPCTTPAELV